MINITINRNRIQTFSFRISSLSPRRRFSLFGGSRTKLDSRKTHTSHHRTYISMAPQHRKFLKIEIHAYLFRFLFSIPPYFRLNPPWAQLLHFGLSCLESIRSAFFLAAFGTLHGEGGAGRAAWQRWKSGAVRKACLGRKWGWESVVFERDRDCLILAVWLV
jgi:hypothetical protein